MGKERWFVTGLNGDVQSGGDDNGGFSKQPAHEILTQLVYLKKMSKDILVVIINNAYMCLLTREQNTHWVKYWKNITIDIANC